MEFNYAKLLGRMKELGFTLETLAKAIGINKGTLSAKLNNHNFFTSGEIARICEVLNIEKEEIGLYFYTLKVQKN